MQPDFSEFRGGAGRALFERELPGRRLARDADARELHGALDVAVAGAHPREMACRWVRQGLRHLFDMAHSAWPLQAVEFQLLEAVSCPCQVRRETPEKRSAFSPPFLAFPQHDTRFCPCQDLDIAALPQRSHRAGITLNCRSVGRVVALLP